MKLLLSISISLALSACKGSCQRNDFNTGINKLNKNLPTREQNLREQEKRWRNNKIK